MIYPTIAVFAGGTSSEREVSLGSGMACALALSRHFPTRLFSLNTDSLPTEFDPTRFVVFSTLHGTFGEDGGMQGLLDGAGAHYAGCEAASSELTMDKARTKKMVAALGVGVAPDLVFSAERRPTAETVLEALGEHLVLKPNDQGSSVGLRVIGNRTELSEALVEIKSGNWLIEKRIVGRELSVGVINGRAMGVVEIRPKSGIYDYSSKYTKGLTEYLAPAPLDDELTAQVRRASETAFAACGCRDYGRVDFIFSRENELVLLEINTLPGMKETSLLPMSARCLGLDFPALVKALVEPALRRFHAASIVTTV